MGRVTSVGWREVSGCVSGLMGCGLTYTFEVLGYCQDCACTFEDVGNAISLNVADVDVAVVEGSEHLLPCLELSAWS